MIVGLVVLSLDLLLTVLVDLPSLKMEFGSFGIVVFLLLIMLQASYFGVAVACALKDPTDPTIDLEKHRKLNK